MKEGKTWEKNVNKEIKSKLGFSLSLVGAKFKDDYDTIYIEKNNALIEIDLGGESHLIFITNLNPNLKLKLIKFCKDY